MGATTPRATNPFDHQRRHPVLTVTLFAAMLAPGPVLLLVAGRLLHAYVPRPDALAIALGGALFVLLFVVGMFAGATGWLLVVKHVADRAAVEPFFVYPGVPVFSSLAAKIFAWAYRAPRDQRR